MNAERSDSSETPRRGIARFLRGEVTDRFLGGAGFSAAAAAPITLDVKIGDQITLVTDRIPPMTTTIPAITETMPANPVTTTIPNQIDNLGRLITAEITAVTPGITRAGDFLG